MAATTTPGDVAESTSLAMKVATSASAPETPQKLAMPYRRSTIESATVAPRPVRIFDIAISPKTPSMKRKIHGVRKSSSAGERSADSNSPRSVVSHRASKSKVKNRGSLSPTKRNMLLGNLESRDSREKALENSNTTQHDIIFSSPPSVKLSTGNILDDVTKTSRHSAPITISTLLQSSKNRPVSTFTNGRESQNSNAINHRRNRAMATNSACRKLSETVEEHDQEQPALVADTSATEKCDLAPAFEEQPAENRVLRVTQTRQEAEDQGTLKVTADAQGISKSRLISLVEKKAASPKPAVTQLTKGVHHADFSRANVGTKDSLTCVAPQLDALGITNPPYFVPMERQISPTLMKKYPTKADSTSGQQQPPRPRTPYASPTISDSPLPKIVVTPPNVVMRQRRTHITPSSTLALACLSGDTTLDSIISTDSSTSLDSSGDLLSEMHTLPSFETQELRSFEDQRGLKRFKMVVDAFLSDFFVERSEEYVESMLIRLVDLLHSSMDPEGSCDFRSYGSRQIQIPSLCAFAAVGESEQKREYLSPQWVRWKLQETLESVLEHVVTGMVALITDDRAPYNTPRFMASLTIAVRDNLVTPHDIHFGFGQSNVKHSSSNKTHEYHHRHHHAFGHWMQACATAIGIHHKVREIPTPADMVMEFKSDPEAATAWHQSVSEISPADRFVALVLKNMAAILERGQAARERNNLLVVPPPRRGSRRRWQAVHAEHQAQKAWHTEFFSKLAKGEISEKTFRSEERKRAALGDGHDTFAALNMVRFVGELFKVSVVDIHTIRAWLRRLLFDTVFPGIPSTYELEAGCALLITVGATLDALSDESQQVRIDDGIPKRTPPLSSSFLMMHGDSSQHIGVQGTPGPTRTEMSSSPCSSSPSSISSSSSTAFSTTSLSSSYGELVRITLSAAITRLGEIERIEEVGQDGQSWCREVVALHARGWRQPPSTECIDAISSAAHAARNARRGGGAAHGGQRLSARQRRGA